MALSRLAFAQLAEAILEIGAKKATKYFSPREVLKATRQGKRNKRSKSTTILFTMGAPNYAERRFIKASTKAGERFPVKKLQLQFDKPPAKAAKAT